MFRASLKIQLWRLSAAIVALGLLGAVACSTDSVNSCYPSSQARKQQPVKPITCGPGTRDTGTSCEPR